MYMIEYSCPPEADTASTSRATTALSRSVAGAVPRSTNATQSSNVGVAAPPHEPSLLAYEVPATATRYPLIVNTSPTSPVSSVEHEVQVPWSAGADTPWGSSFTYGLGQSSGTPSTRSEEHTSELQSR